MPKLIIQDQLKIKQPKVIPLDSGVIAVEALAKNFDHININKTKIYINDILTLPTDSTLNQPLNDGDILTVVQEVKGVIGDVVSGVFGLVGDVIGGALELFIDIPEFDTQTQGSPNNSFSGQTNVINPYALKPVVCGSPRVYPYLAAPPLEYYIGNNKAVEQSFIVSYGTFTGGDVLAGESLAVNSGATVERFTPVSGTTTIPNYRVSRSVDEVSGQTIRGTNEGTIGQSYALTQGSTSSTYSGQRFTAYVSQTTVSDQLKSDFDAGFGDIRLYYDVDIIDGEGQPDTLNVYGTGSITSMTLNAGEYEIIVDSFNGPTSLGAYTVTSLSTIVSSGIGPFKNPIDCTKMFFNIVFAKGLKNTVDLEVKTYRTNGKNGSRIAGTEETFNVSYTEDSPNDAIRRTFEVQPTGTGSGNDDWYEFECYRTNEESQDATLPDVATLESVQCIQELGDFDFDNVTMMRVITRADANDQKSGASNKINILGGVQEMPSYDTISQTITPNAPSRMAPDVALFMWRDFYKKDPTLLNLDELYGIYDDLPDNLMEFDYTFDNVDKGVGEVLDTILDVMRVKRYWDGTQMRFWRDESTQDSGLLSRVDMAAESERSYKLSRQSFVTGQFDSIQVEYVDRTINKKAYIYRSFDASGNIVNVPGANPKNKYLVGCQNEINAINRAELEIRKLKYGRWTLTDTFLDSQRVRSKGDVVRYNEVYEGGDSFGGEIKAVNGGTATTSGKLGLDPAKTYEAYYTNNIGGLIGPQTITASTSSSFTVASLDEAYTEGFDGAQLGSRYYITEVNDTMIRKWRITGKESSGYNVQLSMIGYDERIYEYDTI